MSQFDEDKIADFLGEVYEASILTKSTAEVETSVDGTPGIRFRFANRSPWLPYTLIAGLKSPQIVEMIKTKKRAMAEQWKRDKEEIEGFTL